MDELLDLLRLIVRRCEELNSELAAFTKREPNLAPIAGLNMTHQATVLTLEATSFYKEVWSNFPEPPPEIAERLRQENGERLALLYRGALILILSSFEFSSKTAILENPGNFKFRSERDIFLGSVMEKSFSLGIIDATDKDIWINVLEIRNALVHRNGVAKRTISFTLPNGELVNLQENTMIRGTLRVIPSLILWSVEAYGRWCKAFLQ